MNHPDELRYTRGDWWLREEEDASVTLGVTAWKAEELGEIVSAELADVGAHVQGEQGVGVVESLKSVSELHAPFAGTVLETNPQFQKEPSLANEDPFGRGWMLRLRPDAAGALNGTLSRDEYLALRGVVEAPGD